jgi:regulator of protease activity HflC (stomatin/prohibitin superfamily)
MPVDLIVLLLVLIVLCASSIKIIKEYQRAAVFRLGQLIGVRGPGLIFVLPMVDKAEIVDLNKWIPGWRGLSEDELRERVKSVALSHPEK